MIRLALTLLLLTGCKKKPAVDFTLQLQNRYSLPSCSEDILFCDDELDDLPELIEDMEGSTDNTGDK